MKQRTLTILLLSAVTVLSIHVLYRAFEGLRVDLTSQNIYSLSGGTEQILARMGEQGVQPVEIKLYFSESTGKTPAAVHQRLHHLRALPASSVALLRARLRRQDPGRLHRPSHRLRRGR